MSQKLCKFYITAAYSGLSPIMPGTAGTGVAMIIAYFASLYYPDITLFIPWLCVTLFVTFSGIWTSNLALDWKMFPPKNPESKAKDHDPSQIVIDEVAGYFVSTLGLSTIGTGFDSTTLILGFIFFRLFDITKPGLVRRAEHLPGGYGIMMDDVLAGIFANLSIRIVLFYFR